METLVGVLGFFLVSIGMKEVKQSCRYGKKEPFIFALSFLTMACKSNVITIFGGEGGGMTVKKKVFSDISMKNSSSPTDNCSL